MKLKYILRSIKRSFYKKKERTLYIPISSIAAFQHYRASSLNLIIKRKDSFFNNLLCNRAYGVVIRGILFTHKVTNLTPTGDLFYYPFHKHDCYVDLANIRRLNNFTIKYNGKA